jgi:hypothetical protein
LANLFNRRNSATITFMYIIPAFRAPEIKKELAFKPRKAFVSPLEWQVRQDNIVLNY